MAKSLSLFSGRDFAAVYTIAIERSSPFSFAFLPKNRSQNVESNRHNGKQIPKGNYCIRNAFDSRLRHFAGFEKDSKYSAGAEHDKSDKAYYPKELCPWLIVFNFCHI